MEYLSLLLIFVVAVSVLYIIIHNHNRRLFYENLAPGYLVGFKMDGEIAEYIILDIDGKWITVKHAIYDWTYTTHFKNIYPID